MNRNPLRVYGHCLYPERPSIRFEAVWDRKIVPQPRLTPPSWFTSRTHKASLNVYLEDVETQYESHRCRSLIKSKTMLTPKSKVQSDDEYEVIDIIARRYRCYESKEAEYFVHWRDRSYSWEEAGNLTNCVDLLQIFWTRSYSLSRKTQKNYRSKVLCDYFPPILMKIRREGSEYAVSLDELKLPGTSLSLSGLAESSKIASDIHTTSKIVSVGVAEDSTAISSGSSDESESRIWSCEDSTDVDQESITSVDSEETGELEEYLTTKCDETANILVQQPSFPASPITTTTNKVSVVTQTDESTKLSVSYSGPIVVSEVVPINSSSLNSISDVARDFIVQEIGLVNATPCVEEQLKSQGHDLTPTMETSCTDLFQEDTATSYAVQSILDGSEIFSSDFSTFPVGGDLFTQIPGSYTAYGDSNPLDWSLDRILEYLDY